MTTAKLQCILTVYQALYPVLKLHYTCIRQILHDCKTLGESGSQKAGKTEAIPWSLALSNDSKMQQKPML